MTRREDTEKLFYRIGEVSRLAGVKPHVLRYWETEFDQIRPVKSGRGQRLYRRRDLDVVNEIKRLLYEEGYTVAGAKKALKVFNPAAASSGDGKKKKRGLQRAVMELKSIREMLKD